MSTSTISDDTTVSISEAARLCHCSEKTVRRRVRGGTLPARLVDGRYQLRLSDLLATTVRNDAAAGVDVIAWARRVAAAAPPVSAETAAEVGRILQGADRGVAA